MFTEHMRAELAAAPGLEDVEEARLAGDGADLTDRQAAAIVLVRQISLLLHEAKMLRDEVFKGNETDRLCEIEVSVVGHRRLPAIGPANFTPAGMRILFKVVHQQARLAVYIVRLVEAGT